MSNTLQALAGVGVALVVGAAVALAGSQGSVHVAGWPLFALCATGAYVMQWIVFVPSFLARTERYFDLTGSVTYLTVVLAALGLTGADEARAILLTVLVCLWATRLGAFLFARIQAKGNDPRFDALKSSLPHFLMVWTLQGLWVVLTAGAALAAITSKTDVPLGLTAGVGAIVWGAGFVFEAVADAQKRAFRRDTANRDAFIDSGLWAYSRHPNYFGEITLWVGIALIAAPGLFGWQYVTLISPVFVYLLLTRVSGIPMVEQRADERWGDQPAYQAYKARTPALVPRPTRRRRGPGPSATE